MLDYKLQLAVIRFDIIFGFFFTVDRLFNVYPSYIFSIMDKYVTDREMSFTI